MAEPYFICSMVRVEPRPRKPMPWRRLAVISSRCLGKGSWLISTTLSSMRVKMATTLRNACQSKLACSVKG
ncbi:hypothetical protein D3C84_930810 [compost metagenome]